MRTCISCHHLQTWAGAYHGGRPPTACSGVITGKTDRLNEEQKVVEVVVVVVVASRFRC